MITAILSHTPLWVWGLLAGLLLLGLSQTRSRQVGRGRLLLLPLAMLALGLWSLSSTFTALPVTALAWLVALAATLALRLRLPPRAGTAWLPDRQLLQLPGSWVPLLTILAIFSLRYTVNVLLALHPGWQHDAPAMAAVAALYGALGGLLAGGALGLLRLTRPTVLGQVATMPSHA